MRRKGGEWKPAVFTDDTAIWLGARLKERIGIARGQPWLFPNIYTGEKLTRDGWRAICYRLAERAKIPKFSPHALRRSMAVLASQNGMPTHVIAAQGGWKDIKQVQRYTAAMDVEAARPWLAGLAVDDGR